MWVVRAHYGKHETSTLAVFRRRFLARALARLGNKVAELRGYSTSYTVEEW